MIKFLKADTGVFIKYDTEAKTSTVLVKAELQKQIDFLQGKLNELPAPLTNTEKLAWFEANYNGTNYEQSRTALKTQIAEIKAQIEEMVS